MNKIGILIICLFAFSNSLFAQNSIKLIDGFGPLGLEDIMARLDAFAYESVQNEGSKMLIRVESGTVNSFSSPFVEGALMKAYLTNSRKMPDEKVLIQYCNIGERDIEIHRQLFIVPLGAKIDSCNEQITLPKQTKFYSTVFSENPYNTFDEKNDGCCYIEGAGEAANKIKYETLLKIISQNPEMKIYLIGYAGHFTISKEKQTRNGEYITEEKTKTDSEKIIDKLLKKEKEKLKKKGIDLSKIFTIKGGYRKDERSVGLYLIPKTGEIPKPKPDYFPRKK